MSHYKEVAEKRRVDAIRPGDVVDLQGDKYADPRRDENALLAFQYMTVTEIEREGAGCIVLHFDENESIGFPPDHVLDVRMHDERFDGESSNA